MFTLMITGKRFLARTTMVWGFLVLFASVAAQGATHTWTGAKGSLWSIDGNWIGGPPVGDPNADLVFPAIGSGRVLVSTDDLPGATAIDSIEFAGSGYFLNSAAASSSILLGRIDVANTGGAFLALPIAFTGSQPHQITMSARLQISGPISGGFQAWARWGDPLVLTGPDSASITVGHDQPSQPAFVLVNGSNSGEALILSGTLGGAGTTGSILMQGPFDEYGVPGVIRPGGENNTGILSVAGYVTMNTSRAANQFQVRLNGATVGGGYDQLNASGAVFIAMPSQGYRPIHLEVSLGFTPAIGDRFTIVEAAGGVTGNFDVGGDGSTFTVNGITFLINYTSNSIILTRVA